MTLGCFSPSSCLCKSNWQALEKEGIKGYIKALKTQRGREEINFLLHHNFLTEVLRKPISCTVVCFRRTFCKYEWPYDIISQGPQKTIYHTIQLTILSNITYLLHAIHKAHLHAAFTLPEAFRALQVPTKRRQTGSTRLFSIQHRFYLRYGESLLKNVFASSCKDLLKQLLSTNESSSQTRPS